MRLTRETLIKIARDTAQQRVRVSRRIVSIYLTGSVLEEEPLLGGTTDIDLVIIHDSEPLQEREIVRLTEEVHLDISHYPQALFHHPRRLRSHPWLGPFLYSKPLVFHDTQHWFDFTQAATGAQFYQPDYVIQRANALAQAARQSWMDLSFNPPESHSKCVLAFLKAIEDAGNALASLTGNPLAERRFFLQIPHRLQSLRRPELTGGLVHLFLPEESTWEASWTEMLNAWKSAYQTCSGLADTPARLHPSRQAYYARAAAALWEENPAAAIWLIMRTWTLMVDLVSAPDLVQTGWHSAIQALQLDEASFARRLEEMDQYLDRVEETLDEWAQNNGASTTAEI